MRLEATLNGRPFAAEHEPGASLLSTLRAAEIHGPKKGCESGDCGCCTVWLDGDAIQSCLLPAYRAQGRALLTIEGLDPAAAHPVQQAFLAEEGFQCGYCTAGMVMTLAAPGAATCRTLAEKLRGNICRCTGWSAIRRAAEAVPPRWPEHPKSREHPSHVSESSPGSGHSGEIVPNRHGPAVVAGAASFTADFPESSLLHLAVVRSPHAHARIRHIDTSAALAAPGVVAVFTHRDVPRIPFSTGCHPGEGRDALDTRLLDDTARFVGQRLVVVAAETVAQARRACALVRIDYDVLPAVLDPVAALAPGAPLVHSEPDIAKAADPARNLVAETTRRRGDPEAAFADPALVVVARDFSTGRQQHAHLEPHVSTAWLDPEGRLVVRTSTQVPFLARRTLARVLQFPEAKIRVFKPLVGGGFGNKQEVLSEDLAALVALRTGRPASWEFTREEEFIATSTRHPMRIAARAAARPDGELVALSLDYVADAGAYGNHSAYVLDGAAYEALAMYRCPHKAVRGRAAYTHTLPAGAFRGYGATQTVFAIESLIDELAARLGLDPWEFRRRNVSRTDDDIRIDDAPDPGHRVGPSALDACLAHARDRLAASPLPPDDADWLHGEGHAVSNLTSGIPRHHRSGARIQLTDTGYLLSVGAADLGTGSDTALAQVAALALNTAFDRVAVRFGDTASGTPADDGAFASATAYIAGRAVQLAAERLRAEIDAALARENLADESALHARLAARGETLEVVVADFAQDQVSLSFAALAMQLRVHRRTGRVELLRCVQAIDAGRLINPRLCLGQAEGGAVMGFGFALTEELVVGPDGAVANPCFRDYRVPSLTDVPPIETTFFQPEDPDGPHGAKAIGELTTNAAPAAIANAVARALGTRSLTTLPITPERICRALGGK